MTHRRRGPMTAVAAALVVTLLVVAALPAPSRAAKPLEKFTLLLPTPHDHTYRLAYIALEKGWFRDEGLDIEWNIVPGGAVNIVPQLAQGAGDVAWAGGYTVIQARAKGAPALAIMGASTETLWGLISHKAAGIQKPADLKGKTIGVVAFSSATHFMAKALLKAGGLTEADVDLKPVGMGGPASLAHRQIDAYIWFKPQGLALQLRGTPVDVLDLDPYVPLPQDFMLTTDRVARTRPEALRGYLRALKKAYEHDFDPKNWEENNGYQARWAPESVQDKRFLKALREFTHAGTERDIAKGWRWGFIDAERIDKAQDFLHEIKVIDRKVPVEEMFSNAFLPS
jgi:NitT/TauT family transport system substrate-binding protein